MGIKMMKKHIIILEDPLDITISRSVVSSITSHPIEIIDTSTVTNVKTPDSSVQEIYTIKNYRTDLIVDEVDKYKIEVERKQKIKHKLKCDKNRKNRKKKRK
jgi:hypothetical protein